MPKTEYELTTPMAVSRQDMIELLQDGRRFLVAGGSTIESSIQHDEATDKWSGTSTTGLPVLPKPTFTGTITKTDDGSHWHLEASQGVVTTHEWSVEAVSDQECRVTEKATFEAPLFIFYSAQWQLKSLQQKTHKNIQEYMT